MQQKHHLVSFRERRGCFGNTGICLVFISKQCSFFFFFAQVDRKHFFRCTFVFLFLKISLAREIFWYSPISPPPHPFSAPHWHDLAIEKHTNDLSQADRLPGDGILPDALWQAAGQFTFPAVSDICGFSSIPTPSCYQIILHSFSGDRLTVVPHLI